MTDINFLLKTVYSPEGIKHLENKSVDLLKRLGKSSRTCGGLGFEFSVNLKGNQLNLGAINSDQTLPDGGGQSGAKGLILPKVEVQVVQMTGLQIAQSKLDYEAYANGLTENLDQGMADHFKDLEQQGFRDGTGIIAKVNGNQTSANIVFDNGVPTHFRTGMKVAIYQGATLQGEAIVNDVDIAANTVNLDSSVTVTDNAEFYRVVGNISTKTGAPAGGKEFAGLKLYTDDGTISATYENINRTTNPGFKGIAVDKNGANLSDDMLQQLRARIKVKSGMSVKSSSHYVISNTSQMRKYMNILVPAREYRVGDKMDSSGDIEPTWMGLTWVECTDCGFDEVYLLNKTDFQKYVLEDAHYEEEFSGAILKWNGKDSATAYSRSYMNLGGEAPNTSARAFNLAVPTF